MNRGILFFFISIIFISCHSLVEDKFEDVEKKPVVNALLQTDSIIKVHVSFPERLDGFSPASVDNAEVTITSSEGWTETLAYADNGMYYSTRTGKEGAAYTCSAAVPGYAGAAASTTIPRKTTIKDVKYTEHAGLTEEGFLISSIQFTIENNTEQALYWELYFWEKHEANDYWEESLENSEIYMEAGQDKVLLNEAFPLTVFSNAFMDSRYTVTFYFSENFVDVRNGNDYYVELRTVDEPYYKYQKQKYLYDTSENTGLGSSVQTYPLYSNVTNGYGIFTSYSTACKTFNYRDYQEWED